MKRAIIKTIQKGLSAGYFRFELLDTDEKKVAQSVHVYITKEGCIEVISHHFPEYIILDCTVNIVDYELIDDVK